MPQDAFTLLTLSKELNTLLTGGKVNRITQPQADEIYLDIYNKKNYRLIISANVESYRVSICETQKENPVVPKNFCMLLRKHLLGATIISVSQEDFERVIKIKFLASNEFFDATEKIIYAEVMGKYSNIILTENGIILGAIKQANFEQATLRPIMSGLKYQNPPRQDKLIYNSIELEKTLGLFSGGNLGDYIFDKVKGLAKNTAYQIVFLFFKTLEMQKLEDDKIELFAKFIKKYIEFPPLQPNVAVGNKGLVDFFATEYNFTQYDKIIKFETLYEAEEYFYREKENNKLFKEKKQALITALKNEEKKYNKRLNIILTKEKDCANLEKDKIFGELLITYSYMLKSGEDFTIVENYYDDNRPVKITLDKNLSIKENAQKYYKKYNKQKRTLEAISVQKEEVISEIDYIKSVYSEIELITNIEDFKNIEEELIKEGILKSANQKRNKKEKESSPYIFEIEGIKVKVGKNNVQNDKLISEARGKDIWLHVKKYHSSHGIIEVREKNVTEKIIRCVADIVAYYSECRNGSKIEVDYTEKRYVKKPSGAKMGFVNYTDYKTVIVNPDKHEEFLKSK